MEESNESSNVADPDPSDPYPMFLGLLDPDPNPLVRCTDPDPYMYHQAKLVRKTLIPTVLLLLFDFLSLKNDVNVISKSYKLNFFLLAFRWRLEGQ